MAVEIRSKWEPQLHGVSRKDRHGCFYNAYVPDPISGWELLIPGDIAADIADAESAVQDLNHAGATHVSLEGLARFLLRAEAVGSSKIEGLNIAARRLARAESSLAESGESSDQTAVEILGNIKAMEAAIDIAVEADPFTLDDLLAIHRKLMENSPNPEYGGVVRQEQNWIGGNSYNPCFAVFVPPPPDQVRGLLDDLLGYVNGDDHSPLVQAALAHAQFETIHPFADGNGRTGRALVHLILRRRGLAPAFVPPISLILATWSKSYVDSLQRFRHLSEPDSAERSASTHDALRLFATATQRSCVDARRYAENIDALTVRWRTQLGSVRAKSATELLLAVLPGAPIVTVNSAMNLIGRSKPSTNAAIRVLADAGILRQRNVHKLRYRIFEATDVLDLFNNLERTLGSPVGNTSVERPNRPVPRKPQTPGHPLRRDRPS